MVVSKTQGPGPGPGPGPSPGSLSLSFFFYIFFFFLSVNFFMSFFYFIFFRQTFDFSRFASVVHHCYLFAYKENEMRAMELIFSGTLHAYIYTYIPHLHLSTVFQSRQSKIEASCTTFQVQRRFLRWKSVSLSRIKGSKL